MRLDSIAKVSDLKLDVELQKKSEDIERNNADERFRGAAFALLGAVLLLFVKADEPIDLE